MALFKNRRHAGKLLGQNVEALASLKGRSDLLVLGLPRGGVPVAFEVAEQLAAPLDVLVVRKLGVPGHEELAMGAVASGGLNVLNRDIINALGVSGTEVARVIAQEEREVARRELAYRPGKPPIYVQDKCVILVDDGLATGSTMRAAVQALRREHPRYIMVAVPVAPQSTCDELRMEADEVVCLNAPAHFFGVGQWYEDFAQTTDDEVRRLLKVTKFDPLSLRMSPLTRAQDLEA